MFQCNLLDAGRRPGEFMYYYFSNHCKCDIVIQKIHYASDVPGGGQDAEVTFLTAVTMWGIHKSEFRNYQKDDAALLLYN